MTFQTFKTSKTYPKFSVNADGSAVYYADNLLRITINNSKSGKFKTVYVNRQSIHVGRLVYCAFVGELPRGKHIYYIDGNGLNTHYTNIGPRRLQPTDEFKPVPGFKDLYINADGSQISQNGLEVLVHVNHNKPTGIRRRICCLYGDPARKFQYVAHLVLYAWSGWNGKGRVIHLDGNRLNDHYTNLQAYNNKAYKKFMFENVWNKQDKKKRLNVLDLNRDDVIKRLSDGEVMQAIADDYAVSVMCVSRFRRRHFKDIQLEYFTKHNGKYYSHLTKDLRMKVIKDLNAGKLQKDIAEKYNLSQSAVSRVNIKRQQNKL